MTKTNRTSAFAALARISLATLIAVTLAYRCAGSTVHEYVETALQSSSAWHAWPGLPGLQSESKIPKPFDYVLLDNAINSLWPLSALVAVAGLLYAAYDISTAWLKTHFGPGSSRAAAWCGLIGGTVSVWQVVCIFLASTPFGGDPLTTCYLPDIVVRWLQITIGVLTTFEGIVDHIIGLPWRCLMRVPLGMTLQMEDLFERCGLSHDNARSIAIGLLATLPIVIGGIWLVSRRKLLTSWTPVVGALSGLIAALAPFLIAILLVGCWVFIRRVIGFELIAGGFLLALMFFVVSGVCSHPLGIPYEHVR